MYTSKATLINYANCSLQGTATFNGTSLSGFTGTDGQGVIEDSFPSGKLFLKFTTGSSVSYPDNSSQFANVFCYKGYGEIGIKDGKMYFYNEATSSWIEIMSVSSNTTYWTELYREWSGEGGFYTSTDGVTYTFHNVGTMGDGDGFIGSPVLGNHSDSTLTRAFIGGSIDLSECRLMDRDLVDTYWYGLANKTLWNVIKAEREYDVTPIGTAIVDYLSHEANHFLGGYLVVNKQLPNTVTSAEFGMHIKTPENSWGGLYNSSMSQGLGWNSQDYYGIMTTIEGTATTPVWRLRIGGGGSSWAKESSGLGNPLLNTEYWIKVTWNGTRWSFQISTDGTSYTELYGVNYGWYTAPKQLVLGCCPSSWEGKCPFAGTIYVDDCYIKLNGSDYWKGSDSGYVEKLGIQETYETTLDTPGTYTVTIPTTGDYEVVCVGAGGPAAMRGVYDDKGYGWGGGSGGAFKGVFTLAAGSYTVVVGSANNNTTAQSGNTQTLNPSDTTTHDSSIDGVVVCGGGGAGHYNTNYVGAAGAAPVLSLVPVSTVLSTAGNAGSYNSGGKGSAAAAVCAGGTSVYLNYGRGQGCRTSEYAANRSWINGTNGYVRIRSVM